MTALKRRFTKLKAWTHERFPELEGITHRWSGRVLDTPDHVAGITADEGGVERAHVSRDR
jgi:hypothetical protein